MRPADLLRGDDSLVCVCGRHSDVDDRDVGPRELHLAEQLLCGADLADDVEAGLEQQPLQAFPEQHLVVCDYDPHGISTRIFARPSASRTTSSVPPAAPTRSPSPTISLSAMSASTSITSRSPSVRAASRSGMLRLRLSASETTK